MGEKFCGFGHLFGGRSLWGQAVPEPRMGRRHGAKGFLGHRVWFLRHVLGWSLEGAATAVDHGLQIISCCRRSPQPQKLLHHAFRLVYLPTSFARLLMVCVAFLGHLAAA